MKTIWQWIKRFFSNTESEKLLEHECACGREKDHTKRCGYYTDGECEE